MDYKILQFISADACLPFTEFLDNSAGEKMFGISVVMLTNMLRSMPISADVGPILSSVHGK